MLDDEEEEEMEQETETTKRRPKALDFNVYVFFIDSHEFYLFDCVCLFNKN